jgi:hypothetical protein
MTRCTQKTLQGKRCKKHASHNGKCLLHIGKVVSETSSETTVEINLPTITASSWCSHMDCELWGKLCCRCADTRPRAMLYSKYIDGYGDMPIAKRDEGYCPSCKDDEPHDNKQYIEKLHSETLDAIVCILSRLTEVDIDNCLRKAIQRKRMLEMVETERT